MQNIPDWKPSKFIKDGKSFKPNLKLIDIQSYYICKTYIGHYTAYIREFSRGKLLDCGCGQVPYYEIYKDLVDEVTCTDWQNSMHDNKFVDTFSDLNERLNFNDDSFDTVLLTDVMEHIFKPEKLLCEIHRVLRPGGRVIIAVPFMYRIHEEPHDYYRYTEYSLKKLCDEAGLKIIKIEPYGGYFDVLFDTLNKVFVRKRYMLRLFLPFTRFIKGSFINRKINKAHHDKYPLGYILCAEKGGGGFNH
jgi:SAM-dependent methyltransferase